MFDKEKIFSDATAHQAKGISTKWRNIFAILAIVGAATFVFRIMGDAQQRTWQVFLVNFLYFTGMAQGMIIVACVMQITSARWGSTVKRFGQFGAFFLPVSLVFLAVLYFGRNHIFTWIADPVPEKASWLNVNFLFVRDFVGFILLAVLSFLFLNSSVRRDSKSTHGSEEMSAGGTDGATDSKLGLLAPILVMAFSVIYTVIAFDLIMSLDPHWYSTLFGAYFFITCFLSGLAGLVVIMVISRKHLGLESYITLDHFHDLGKLMFGFLVLAGDFFWSQFIVIWYGNLPEETEFVVLRTRQVPWEILTKVVFLGAFAIPFLLLLSRNLKKKPALIMTVSIIVLSNLWIERFLLIVPSIWKEHFVPLGIFEVLISLGFLGLFGWVYLIALQRNPALPVNDPLFLRYVRGETGH